ncbi:MAG TPA: hypothetical protein VF519_15550 [Mycobacteriales bacterium]|jgi:hypothetical protein
MDFSCAVRRAVIVAAAAVLAAPGIAPAAGPGAGPGAPASPLRGGPPGAPPGRVAPLGAAVSVAASPRLVPPNAPVDVTVTAPAFAGREAEVQLATGPEWAVVARVVLDHAGTAVARLARREAATYEVRAVVPLAAGAGAASEPAALEVTDTGLGDPRAYRYLFLARGVPARWNPCAVVTFRVNAAAARGTSLADLREALRRVTWETGVRFRELGSTRYVPGGRGFRYEADLVVAWTHATDSALLGGSRAATGGFEQPVAGRGGRPRIRHGFVVVDVARLAGVGSGFGAGRTEGELLLHELGHVMGLDHVDADHQMMRPELEPVGSALYGAGDLTGLRRIGRRAGCV